MKRTKYRMERPNVIPDSAVESPALIQAIKNASAPRTFRNKMIEYAANHIHKHIHRA